MNKIVVITGAGTGIGLELYKQYKERGETPICLARTNEANLENFIVCDVTKEDLIISAFNEIKEKYGRIDVLINNAGFGINGSIELEKSEIVRSLIDVNFMGEFLCYKYALPLMHKGAKIVNMSSICALIPIPYRGFYCSSKAAVHLMSLTEYMELKQSGISVISICPGQTKSNFDKNRIRNLETNERYKDTIQKANETLKKSTSHSMETNKVAYSILKETYKKNPKPIKIIGFKYKLFYFFYRITPIKLFLAITKKFLGK